jgi:hypothetical protein
MDTKDDDIYDVVDLNMDEIDDEINAKEIDRE